MEASHLRGIQRRSTAALAERKETGDDTRRKALLVCGVASSLLYALMILGIRYEGKRFRLYSIVTIVVLLVFGGLTVLEAPRLQMNLPTPWIGLWERINISVFLLWVVVLAAVLWRPVRTQGETR